MGSKKKNRGRANQGGYSGKPRSAPNDKYAKYAGAVSNKSKRNYADLRLARPDNLKEYASENARPRAGQPAGRTGQTPSGSRAGTGQNRQAAGRPSVHSTNAGGQRRAVPKTAQGAPSQPRKQAGGSSKRTPNAPKQRSAPNAGAAQKPRSARSAAERGSRGSGLSAALGGFSAWVGSVSSGAARNSGGPSRRGKPSPKNGGGQKAGKPASAARAPKAPQYPEDEYSKALNNADFYGPILEKYYIKYPEKQEKRQSPVGSSAAYTPPKPHKRRIEAALTGQDETAAPRKGEKSIAAIATENRGTPNRKKYTKMVKNAKAKGSVPVGPVHRKVHRRDRRQSLLIGAAAVTSAAVLLVSVIFITFFKVNKIEVAGETPYSDSRITELCQFNKGDNIMFIDTANSEQMVLDTLPYVESCKIKRNIPDGVEVEVTCANQLGVTEVNSGFWSIVSTGGKILENVTNVAVVSDSDAVMSVSYEPNVHSAEELAAEKGLPLLSGLDFKSGKVGEYVDSASVDTVNGFDLILKQADALGMSFTKLKYTGRGYEAEYDGRINIVLGDTTDISTVKKRIEIAHHVICERGDITEHDMGELTYLNNETFFNPTYDISEEELAKYTDNDESGIGQLAKFAEALLDRGIDVWNGQQEQSEKAEDTSSRPDDTLARDITDGMLSGPQAT